MKHQGPTNRNRDNSVKKYILTLTDKTSADCWAIFGLEIVTKSYEISNKKGANTVNFDTKI